MENEVVEVVKYMSTDLDAVIERIKQEYSIDYIIGETPSDQIYLKDVRTGHLLAEPINIRQMCDGTVLFVFEHRRL